jgi:aerobic-type carbon monoxide dehydrogenase small subunit (CoxS/CutS family)
MSDRCMHAQFTVNGESMQAQVPVRMHLVDYLREEMGLTGSHLGCEHGVCGACQVMVDGQVVRGCLTLAIQADGKHVQTIEGLTENRELQKLQAAFLKHNAFQCGFCSAGMLLTALDITQHHKNASREEIKELISGNYCRCTGYQAIVDAIESVLHANLSSSSTQSGVKV